MTQKTQTFSIADPRTFEGDPFEVAQRAAAQAGALTRLAASTAEDALVMARNAEMERNLQRGEDPDAAGFDESAQARRWNALLETLRASEKELALLTRVAGFNPKRPPKE